MALLQKKYNGVPVYRSVLFFIFYIIFMIGTYFIAKYTNIFQPPSDTNIRHAQIWEYIGKIVGFSALGMPIAFLLFPFSEK